MCEADIDVPQCSLIFNSVQQLRGNLFNMVKSVNYKILFLRFVFISFTGLSTLLVGCSPEESVFHEKVVDETLSYTFFKTGSKWVYQEATSHQLDTLTVSWHSFNVAYEEEYYKNKYDNYSYQIRSSLFDEVDSNATIYVWIQLFFSNELQEHSVARFNNPAFPLYEEIQYSGFSDTSVKYPILIPESIRLNRFYDSLRIGDSTYLSVKHFIIEETSHPALIKEVFWAKGVGKIRFILDNGQDWTLKSYNVKQ